ncbi:trimethylamine methyltransferase family protein [Cloacibacillus porcorum]|uniref:trimethylamine methyltransferase family protein n=1 Tax=Cloacibacillus porcorum TaxID=1197717 RepID=UPI0023F30EC3|nr:trimethylamine methyltransferase family protein [Cloacibacillus porcorum]MDD7649965.1 trimethylamine methyltransferase family protein [Cloacibacillus porcorum]MDY4093324.1 trimethylamine methyltransferase family protein [Cloacibacillus porcorum]
MYIGKRYYSNESTYHVFGAKEAAEVHAASCRVLQEQGMLVKHEEARELLKQAGALVEGEKVFIGTSLVERSLKQLPSRVAVFDRDGEPAMFLEGRNVYYGSGSDTVNLLDYESRGRRAWTKADVQNAVRICDALPNIDFIMSMGIISDVPFEVNTREQYSQMILNSAKPHVVVADNARDLEDIFKMYIAVRGGAEALRMKPFAVVYNEPTSPLLHSFEAIDKLMLCARYGVPTNYAAGGMAGATTPISPAGTVVLNNAECLMGIVIHQLTSPGAPFVYGFGNSPMDMRTLQCCYALPGAIRIQSGMCEMAHYYNLPCWGEAGNGCSKICDEQAVEEAAQFIQMAALQGCNLTHDIGYLDFGLSYSLELLVISDDIIARTKEVMAGVEINEAALSVDEIKQAGYNGNYLRAASTRRAAKEDWRSDLGDYMTYDNWSAAGSKSMGERAHAKVLKIIEEYQPKELDNAVREKIDEIVRQAY